MAIIRMTRGDNLDIVYTLKDENEALLQMTGTSVSWKALRSGTTTEKISKSGALTDPGAGVTTISLDPADTTSLGGTYALEGEWVDTSGNIYTFEDGALFIETDDTE